MREYLYVIILFFTAFSNRCVSQNVSFLNDTSVINYELTYRDSITGHGDRLFIFKNSKIFLEWDIYFDTTKNQLAYRSYFTENKFIMEEYWSNGNLRYKTMYLDTNTMRFSSANYHVTLYCENGQFVQKMMFGNSEKQHVKSFYCNGNKWVDQYFTRTAKYGVVGNFKYWHENGNIMFDTNYDDDGNRIGEWKYWREDGILERIEIYKDDELIETK